MSLNSNDLTEINKILYDKPSIQLGMTYTARDLLVVMDHLHDHSINTAYVYYTKVYNELYRILS